MTAATRAIRLPPVNSNRKPKLTKSVGAVADFTARYNARGAWRPKAPGWPEEPRITPARTS